MKKKLSKIFKVNLILNSLIIPIFFISCTGSDVGVSKAGVEYNYIDADGDGKNDNEKPDFCTSGIGDSTDSDADGISDEDEESYGTSKSLDDTDGDGLSDFYEICYFGSDPNNTDSDGDGLNDGTEYSIYQACYGDLEHDNDEDGLTCEYEVLQGTDPNDADTDDDALSDSVETDTGSYVDATDTGTDPLDSDTDDDGLLDGVETNTGIYVSSTDTGSDPFVVDTDSDGLTDGEEINTYNTDPNDTDTDDGTVSDYDEVEQGTDPTNPEDDIIEPAVDPDDVGDPYETQEALYNGLSDKFFDSFDVRINDFTYDNLANMLVSVEAMIDAIQEIFEMIRCDGPGSNLPDDEVSMVIEMLAEEIFTMMVEDISVNLTPEYLGSLSDSEYNNLLSNFGQSCESLAGYLTTNYSADNANTLAVAGLVTEVQALQAYTPASVAMASASFSAFSSANLMANVATNMQANYGASYANTGTMNMFR
ncbi:MAG: hypothetical protein ABIA04_12400 [Pseudomonadota bacterium]